MNMYPIKRSEFRNQVKKTRLAYAVIALLLVLLAALWLVSSRAHKRDVAEINRLGEANLNLKIENDELHRINKEIGAERDEAVKWLESIQPGINFDGI